MNTSNLMKRFAAGAGSALMGLMFATGANAANPEPVPVEVEWVAPIGLGENNDIAGGTGLYQAGSRVQRWRSAAQR